MMADATRILLVEDEEELIRIVETVFHDEGYEVRTAMSGEDAVSILANYIPEIIISDVKMANMDGFGLLEWVRKNPATTSTPFIFLTIMDDRDSVLRAEALGVAGYMTKPFDVEELLGKVRSVLGKK
ncbi:MAG: response regulator [Bacteroidota bacterium]